MNLMFQGNLPHLQTTNLYNNIIDDLEITFFKDYIKHILNVISTTKEIQYCQLSSYHFPLVKELPKQRNLTKISIDYNGIKYIKKIFEENNVTIITLNTDNQSRIKRIQNFLLLIGTILETEDNVLGIILKSDTRKEIINVTHPYRMYQILLGQIDIDLYNYVYIYRDSSLNDIEMNDKLYESYLEQLGTLSENYASNLLETYKFLTQVNNKSDNLTNNQFGIGFKSSYNDLDFLIDNTFIQDSTEITYLKDMYKSVQGFSDILLAHRYIPFYCYFDIKLGNSLSETYYEYAILNSPVLSPNLQLNPKKCCIGNEKFDILGLTSLLICNLNSPFRQQVITSDLAIQKAWIRANLNTTYEIIDENKESEMLNYFNQDRKDNNDN